MKSAAVGAKDAVMNTLGMSGDNKEGGAGKEEDHSTITTPNLSMLVGQASLSFVVFYYGVMKLVNPLMYMMRCVDVL